MYQKERLDVIVEFITKHGYVTTKSLIDTFHYSVATINRDLNVLEKQKLVRRTYGGVELVRRKYPPHKFRQHHMKEEKKRIAKKAAELIKSGDRVFIDASTTTEFMIDHLLTKKNITVFTNNLLIASQLSDVGISVYCLGGKIVEPPYLLGGEDTVDMARKYKANKFFFSTAAFTDDGRIGCGSTWYSMYLAIENNCDKTYYLATSDKRSNKEKIALFLHDFSSLTGIISDYEFEDEIKAKFPNTEFIKA